MIRVLVFDPKKYTVNVYGPKYTGTNNFDVRSVEQWSKETKADWTFNLAFFNLTTDANAKKYGTAGNTLQDVVSPTVGRIGYADSVSAKCPLITLPSGSQFKGYGIIIKDNVIQSGLYSNRRSRNMNGLTADGRYIHVQSTAQTEYLVATNVRSIIQKQYGTTVKWLFREDAGGSTSEYSNISKTSFYPEGIRKIPSTIIVSRIEPYTFTKILKVGSKGEDVRELQMALAGIEVDGVYGNGTKAALIKAQTALGFVKKDRDGIFGPQSALAMGYKFQK